MSERRSWKEPNPRSKHCLKGRCPVHYMMGLLDTLGWTRVIKNVLRHVETEEPWGLGTDWQVAFPWFQNLKWQIQCLGEDEEVSGTHESFHPPNQNRADSPNSFGIGTSAPAWTHHYIPGVGRQWFWTHQMVLRVGGEGGKSVSCHKSDKGS